MKSVCVQTNIKTKILWVYRICFCENLKCFGNRLKSEFIVELYEIAGGKPKFFAKACTEVG